MSSGQTDSSGSRSIGGLIAHYFDARGWGRPNYAEVSKHAGLDDQWVERIITPRDGGHAKVRRGSLLKISAAMDLTTEERDELESAANQPQGSLRSTKAEPLQQDKISMRRAVLLLTAPTDPHRLPFHAQRRDVATRSGVVFGWHDVVVRITTPENLSVLDYSDRLFQSKALRTIETIPLRDDLPIYVDQSFIADDSLKADYNWAVIFVQALGTPKKPEFRDIFYEVASLPEFKGCIHLLTAAVAVGQFDSVVEVLAANLPRLQDYVRAAQQRGREMDRDAHTVTYFAVHWLQRPPNAAF